MKKQLLSGLLVATLGLNAQVSLYQTVQGSTDHSTLLAAIDAAGLATTLDDPNIDYTLFAPNNAAFNQFFTDNGISASDLLGDPDLSKVLLHHVIGSNVTSNMLVNNTEAQMLTMLDVNISTMPSPMVDSSGIYNPDVACTNGVLHMIDYPLLPTYDNVTEIVSTSPDHDTLLLALQTANLVSTLQNPNADFTVFAPTDAAFNDFLNANNLTAAQLLADADLSTILLHHVVSGAVESGDLSNGEVPTLTDLDVTVDLTSGVMIDDATVTIANILADNGVVHVIDDILLPTYDDVTEVISTSNDHDTLLLALQTANLVSTLQNPNAEFTVFAPTDAAFATFLNDNGISAADLLSDANLSNVLLHHVVSGTVLSGDLTNGDVPTLNNTNVTVDLSNGVMIDNASVSLANIIADNGVVHVLDEVLTLPVSVGVSSNEVNYVVYPNPTSGIVNLITTESVNFQMYDIAGKMVKSGTITNGTIDMTSLSKGSYWLKIDNSSMIKINKI